ncbi:VOC family protein [Homoserinibacter sp. YIM 151385]|uniref:VOC family protein n=1 Tax=Homoserinibacter sp. YIM 151385 TaxID=2985506 RepID=UPI0022F0F5C3|nr:VOC family protein [Homoserinibacter sp. YIM 151385]WBU37891.1 VOC family protein [Homoserinibacter sp. YIM 151385]
MSVLLNPYLNFHGEAREAAAFYQGVFGGELAVSTYGESGMGESSDAELVMHAQLDTPSGFTLMVSDVPSHLEAPTGEKAFSISLSGDDEAALTGWWERLSDGAEIQEPLARAPWGDSFGMLVDRYGVGWMVNISGAAES